MTPAQCKAARQLLGWGRHKLAAKSRVPVHVIQRFEVSGYVYPPGSMMPQFDRSTAIHAALESGGVEFIEESEGGPGVRLRWPSRAEDFEDVPYAQQPAIASQNAKA